MATDFPVVPLFRAAHARTGDKGDRSNISVVAWHPKLWETLVEQVTVDAVARQFAHRRPSRVQRFLLPRLQAMNFVLDDVLDGGVNDSLNLDSHGKALSFLLLELSITLPAALAECLAGTASDSMITTTERRHALNIASRSIRLITAPRRALVALATLLVAAVGTPAQAQTFPAKPITFIVPFAAGTATDQLARALGQSITADTKQAVVVDNRAGASGMIAAQAVAHAAPDGYTVLITTNTTHAANEHLYKKLTYDPVKDFAPITGIGKGSQVMVVNASSPYKTVADVIAKAKKEPGKLSFGSGSSSSRVAGELFKQMAGVDILHVPYKSNTLAITDLLGGQIDMMITDNATGLPHIRSGKLRALGVSTLKRSPLLPDVPTISEAGVKGYDMGYWFAAYAPAKTPPAVVARLRELLIAGTAAPAAKAFFDSTGSEPFTTTSDGLARFQLDEAQKWGRVIKAAGIEAE